MKQTAVEWLVDYIENQNKNGYEFHPKYAEHIVQQAKEMEKQQIIDTYYEGDSNGAIRVYNRSMRDDILAEDYYNETFKKK